MKSAQPAKSRGNSNRRFLFARGPLASAMVMVACWGNTQAADLTYLQSLLAATPTGGWVKASTNSFSSAWAPEAAAVPTSESHASPVSIVRAWSSMDWDSSRGQMILWGGGHANYRGNEVYTWQASDGAWTRGSLPSRLEQVNNGPTFLVSDGKAPQSAHTYDGNVYLPRNDLFLTLGGAAYNTGDDFQKRDANGNVVSTGPWLWDPRKADADKVGGGNHSGYDPALPGGEMWTSRALAPGTAPANFVQNTSAYREENGKDVIYLTAPGGSPLAPSAFPALYRYAAGDVRQGQSDTWERVGVSWNAPSGLASATIDDRNELYVHTAAIDGWAHDLGVWDLNRSDAANPEANRDFAVDLVHVDGSEFQMSEAFGIDYDAKNQRFLLWDGTPGGTVWETQAEFKLDGSLNNKWTIRALANTSGSAPGGNFVAGVLGKWKYVDELGAFLALNEADLVTGDAEVWLYKSSSAPFAAAVPEPEARALMVLGLAGVAWRCRRSRKV